MSRRQVGPHPRGVPSTIYRLPRFPHQSRSLIARIALSHALCPRVPMRPRHHLLSLPVALYRRTCVVVAIRRSRAWTPQPLLPHRHAHTIVQRLPVVPQCTTTGLEVPLVRGYSPECARGQSARVSVQRLSVGLSKTSCAGLFAAAATVAAVRPPGTPGGNDDCQGKIIHGAQFPWTRVLGIGGINFDFTGTCIIPSLDVLIRNPSPLMLGPKHAEISCGYFSLCPWQMWIVVGIPAKGI